MESKVCFSRVDTSRKACAQVLDEILQHTRDYLATYPKEGFQAFFSSCELSQKEIASAYYEYAARLCRGWDRVAEHLLEIGTLMQEFDAKMDSEAVVRCDAVLTKGRDFRATLDRYLTENERILKSERPLSQLYKQTQSFLFATEQFRLFLTTEAF